MPFCDAYWSRLLNRSYDYEEEIKLPHCGRDERYEFVDCCANFGYWSVLEQACAQQALAIEVGGLNVKRLNGNTELNGNRFRCLNVAIAGGSRRVAGTSHGKLETVPGSDRKHSVSRYLMEENSLSLMVFDPAVRRFVRLDDLRLLDRMKRHPKGRLPRPVVPGRSAYFRLAATNER